MNLAKLGHVAEKRRAQSGDEKLSRTPGAGGSGASFSGGAVALRQTRGGNAQEVVFAAQSGVGPVSPGAER